MGGNKDMWLALGDPMLAKLTGNDWAQDHNREINTAAAAAAAIAAMFFSGGTAAGIGAGAVEGAGAAGGGAAAGAGLTASEIAALDAAGGYTLATGAVDGAAMGASGALGAGAGTAGMTAADIAYLDAMGGYTPAVGAVDGAANFWGSGALLGEAPLGSTLSAMELEAGGGGTGGLMGTGTSAPGDSMTAAKGMSAWDRIGKGLDTYNKYSKIAGAGQGLLAPPQQPQTPQPRPLSMGQAQSQKGPTDWAQFFGPGLSDEEIRKRQLMMMQYGYGAH